jgi:hypothetical protein
MKRGLRGHPARAATALLLVLVLAAEAQPSPRREFGEGRPFSLGDLPRGRFRDRLEQLPAPARERAMAWLHSFRFPAEDVASLHADHEGGIYYVDEILETSGGGEASADEPAAAGAAVPVSPFPEGLKFHSRPGATNVIFLDFDGHVVSGTAWNGSLGRDPIPATAFSTDSDLATFSDAEQAAIKRIWQRVAEDYAAFDVDVTTEEPAAMNNRTARALITRNTDANGLANPSSSAGGVAYIGVFAGSLAYYSPAWVYHNNLSNSEGNIGEAATHELGHNMGLSHDGKTGGTEYYSGHGIGEISWAPHMGVGYGKNVTQWSKGDYVLANNTQDDLAIIANKLKVRGDDHGNTIASPSYLQVSGSNVVATTPETDPDNVNPGNKGVLETRSDADVFAFATGAGTVRLTVRSWLSPGGTRGGNTDMRIRLLDGAGTMVAQADPTSSTYAAISAPVSSGVYYLAIAPVGTGDPTNTVPSGYTDYACVGQYFVTGYIVAATGISFPPQASLNPVPAPQAGQTSLLYSVVYSDNVAVDVSSLGDADTFVEGPGGYAVPGVLVVVSNAIDGTPRTATYQVPAPGGAWDAADNGLYTVRLSEGEVGDVEGLFAAGADLGSVTCNVPQVAYSATMDAHPGWTLEGPWAYGVPQGNNSDPSSGFTGANVIGVNLAGVYTRTQALAYATTPGFNCAGAGTVTLRFRRWLGIRNSDIATIQVAADGSAWTTYWTSSGTTADSSWQDIAINISSAVAGRTNVSIRWGLQANGDNQVSFGWNLDDVQVVVTLTSVVVQSWTLAARPDDPSHGLVTPTGGVYAAGDVVQLQAVPSAYFVFDRWTGAIAGVDNPAVVTMDADKDVRALFTPLVTSNSATPIWWLAQNGYTGDFETAAASIGSNGMPVWASYIAGLSPGDPASVFEVSSTAFGPEGDLVLTWPAISGRVYSIYYTSDPLQPFQPLPGATSLPWPASSYTGAPPEAGCLLYQVRVALP